MDIPKAEGTPHKIAILRTIRLLTISGIALSCLVTAGLGGGLLTFALAVGGDCLFCFVGRSAAFLADFLRLRVQRVRDCVVIPTT